MLLHKIEQNKCSNVRTELTYCMHTFTKSFKMLQFQVESFEYLRMSIDDVLRLDEDIESPTIPGEQC